MKKPLLKIDSVKIRARIMLARKNMAPGVLAAMDSVHKHAQHVYEGFGVDMDNTREKELVAAGITMADWVLLEAVNRGVLTEDQHRVVGALNAAILEPLVRP